MDLFQSPNFFKSLHLIFVVTWFSGLFYIVRLFIYHVEAQKKSEMEKNILSKQYKLMQKRLWYIITWPSMLLTLFIATWMLFAFDEFFVFLKQPWMHLKLGFVTLLVLYHIGCHIIFKQLQKDKFKYSSMQLRIWNEVSTLFLFVIVFLIVYKSLNFYKGIIGFFLLAILLMIGIKLYKKNRKEEIIEEIFENPKH